MRNDVSDQPPPPAAARWIPLIRWLGQAIPYTMLAFIACATTGALDVERRAHIATMAGNLVAGVFVISAPLVVILGIAAMLRRQSAWLAQAHALSMVCAAFSLALLMVVPGIATKLSLDKDMRLVFGPDYVRISGATSVDLPRYLQQSMAPDFKPQRLYLDNGGGDVAAGQAAAGILLERGVRTVIVDGTCSSSCAFMAQRFPHRYLAGDGRLGFHDLHNYAGNSAEQAELKAGLVSRFVAQGVTPDVASALLDSKELVFPKLDELLRDKLITGCWNEASHSAGPCASP